jgi:hypothetical protein
MKAVSRIAAALVLVALTLCTTPIAIGQVVGLLPDSPAMTLQGTMPQNLFLDMFLVMNQMGGAGAMLTISGVLTLLIASLKVSALNPLWDKLGPARVLAGPLLALGAGVAGLGANGAPVTLALVLAYVSAGAGSIILHQVLDALKAVPGLGPIYLGGIEVLERLLGGSKPTPGSQGKQE